MQAKTHNAQAPTHAQMKAAGRYLQQRISGYRSRADELAIARASTDPGLRRAAEIFDAYWAAVDGSPRR